MLKGEYSIGLDVGSTSVGFSAIDDKYRPIKLKGKTVIGTRLFREGQTAAERRKFRTTRRRLSRRKWRLALLEEIFDPYMAKVDPTFFARLKSSNLSPKDENKKFAGSLLFPEKKDSHYFDEYPTIYHLRYRLMEDEKKHDLREVFLAIHHIVKYRGNFLNNIPVSAFVTDKIDLDDSLSKLNIAYSELDPIHLFNIDVSKAPQIDILIFNKNISNLDKSKKVAKLLNISVKDKSLNRSNLNIAKQIGKAIFGYKFNLATVLKIDDENTNQWKIKLDDENIDDTLSNLKSELNEHQTFILETIFKLYSQIKLNGIVPSNMTLSESMIKKYNEHKCHLRLLKEYCNHQSTKTKKEIMGAYASYVDHDSQKNKVISRAEFYKAVTKNLDDSSEAQKISNLIKNDEFMPKQRSNENGVIPYQLHLKELDKIIGKQSKYYPWLAELNPNVSRRNRAKYKIDELVAFKIPYYVGPLITADEQMKTSGAKFAWMIRKESGKITPWNFNKKVDRIESANKFIRRMTTKDSYLYGVDVLPAHSLLYEKFKLLNELNMVRINGHKLSSKQKKGAIENLFKNHKVVLVKQFLNYLQASGIPEKPVITGLSNPTKFNSQLGTYNDFKKIFGKDIDSSGKRTDFEKIAQWLTVFEDKQILKEKLKEINWLKASQITELLSLRYQGWGRLSRKLLIGFKDENNKTIIDNMRDTTATFMQVVSEPVFAKQIKNFNQKNLSSENIESVLSEAFTSPQNKKAIRQVISVVDDIVKSAGKSPKYISIEFARENQVSHRTISRKSQIEQIYQTTAKELVSSKVRHELQETDELSEKYYLYFTQNGKDIYTGDPINIDDIPMYYDVDHILPQSFIKDDSLDNKVLVSKRINNAKSNTVPVVRFGNKRKTLWKSLYDHRLISRKKYLNLLTNPGSIDKFKALGFIHRQLVETRQVIKLAASIFQNRYGQNGTKIIEVKAGLTHQLRTDFALYKNRLVNDYHHAMDGYLTAFIGQYLCHRYSKLRPYFIYGQYQKYNSPSLNKNLHLNKFNFLYDLSSGAKQQTNNCDEIIDMATGEIVGNRKAMIQEINKVYNYKFMLISQEAYTKSGQLFDQTIYPASSKKRLIPIKQNKPVKIYGGYSRNNDCYMSIVRIHKKHNTKYQYKIVGISMRCLNKLNYLENSDHNKYLSYLSKEIKRRLGNKIFDIVIPKVLYGQMIIDKDKKFTLGSASYQYNARQLVLTYKSMAILNKNYSNGSESIAKQNEELTSVYDDILQKLNTYNPLYDKNKFRLALNNAREKFLKLPPLSIFQKGKKIKTGKREILDQILIGLHAGASKGNLKVIGIKTPFGQMQSSSGINLSDNALLINQSPSGLFVRKRRIGNL